MPNGNRGLKHHFFFSRNGLKPTTLIPPRSELKVQETTVHDRMLLRRRIHDRVSTENPYQRAAEYVTNAAIEYIKSVGIVWIGATLCAIKINAPINSESGHAGQYDRSGDTPVSFQTSQKR
jgi:hypothetical protein